MKKGLILEGGAMRGMFTAGVMDVLMENGVKFDGAVGVSAGAAFGCNYKSGQIGRVIRYNTRFIRDKRYAGFRILLKTGNLYSTEFCYGEVPLKHDIFDFEAYKKNPMEFYVVCTDVESGKAVYHKYTGEEKSTFDWIRASASMPLVSQIVTIDDKKLLDGGIADSIPVKFLEGIGYDKNVVVLTQPKGFLKKKNGLLPLMRIMYKKYPDFIKTIQNRHNVYNETTKYIFEEEKKGNLLVICPKEPLPIKRTEKDPQKLRQTYEIGRRIATEKLDSIIEFLNE